MDGKRNKYNIDKEIDEEQIKELRENATSDDCFNFSLKLRKFLIDNKLTQSELSDRTAEYERVTEGSITNYLKAKSTPSLKIIKILSKTMNVSSDYLLGLSEYEKLENANIGEKTGLSDNAIKWLVDESSHPDNYLIAINALFELESFQWFCASLCNLKGKLCFEYILDKYSAMLLMKKEEKQENEIINKLTQNGFKRTKQADDLSLAKHRMIVEYEKLIDEYEDYCIETVKEDNKLLDALVAISDLENSTND